MTQSKKAKNFDNIREIINKLDYNSFTNYDLVKRTGLHTSQIKKILAGLEELREVKYIENYNIYIKNNKKNIELKSQSISNINNNSGGQNKDDTY
jgi:hypothetical protein